MSLRFAFSGGAHGGGGHGGGGHEKPERALMKTLIGGAVTITFEAALGARRRPRARGWCGVVWCACAALGGCRVGGIGVGGRNSGVFLLFSALARVVVRDVCERGCWRGAAAIISAWAMTAPPPAWGACPRGPSAGGHYLEFLKIRKQTSGLSYGTITNNMVRVRVRHFRRARGGGGLGGAVIRCARAGGGLGSGRVVGVVV